MSTDVKHTEAPPPRSGGRHQRGGEHARLGVAPGPPRRYSLPLSSLHQQGGAHGGHVPSPFRNTACSNSTISPLPCRPVHFIEWPRRRPLKSEMPWLSWEGTPSVGAPLNYHKRDSNTLPTYTVHHLVHRTWQGLQRRAWRGDANHGYLQAFFFRTSQGRVLPSPTHTRTLS